MDLAFESIQKSELLADSIHKFGKLERRAYHNISGIFGVDFDSNLSEHISKIVIQDL